MKRIQRWFLRHQLLTALLVLSAVAVPGLIRVEQIAREAHDATERLDADLVRQEEDRAERRHQLCLRDVEDRRDVRAYWDWLFDNLLDPTNPRVQQARAQLDVIHPLLVCNAEDTPVPVPE